MCKDRTSTMKEIYQHFEQHFVEPFSFPNPAGAGSLGKSGPRLDSSTTGTFVMKRSYTETCAAYEAYAVAKPQCKMAKSTCLGLFTAGGLLQHYSYDERSSCMCVPPGGAHISGGTAARDARREGPRRSPEHGPHGPEPLHGGHESLRQTDRQRCPLADATTRQQRDGGDLRPARDTPAEATRPRR